MFDNYRDIFNQRGRQYHQAMEQQPLARRQEFSNVLKLADIRQGHQVCDVPSGGAYLADFIQSPDVKVVSVETSEAFAKAGSQGTIICENLSNLPLESGSFDRVISLAGLHHIEDRGAFYAEIARILRPGGIFCAADVQEGSGVDGFLNGFVDTHNPMGHRGVFFSDTEPAMIEAASLKITSDERIPYPWYFDRPSTMANFCRDLFGIDLASETEIVSGIENTVGYSADDSSCLMNWELRFIACAKSLSI